MDIKAEVLSKIDEEFQGSVIEFVMKSFEANIFSEDMMKMHLEPNGSVSTPRGRNLTSLRECNYPIKME